MDTQQQVNQAGNTVALHKCSRGFTILEVVVIFGIMGLLVLIGYPTIGRFFPNYNLKATTRELQADFQKAKLHAVKNNRDVTFSFTPLFNTPQAAATPCTGAATGYTFTDEDLVVVISKSFDGTGVCILSSNYAVTNGFDPKGLTIGPAPAPAGSELTVQLKHIKIPARDAYEINQSIAGNIRIK